MMRTLVYLFSLAATIALLGGCSATRADDGRTGHLVIVGGGLKDDHAAIFNKFIECCADGPIGIVPTASGDGLEAGEHAAARWRKYAGDRPVVVIPLTQHDAAMASDPAIIARIDSCGGLWFTGGDQSRIVTVFRPDGKDTPAMLAVRRVLERSGVVGGTSAGAAMMSDPMITGGRSRSGRSSDPENEDDRRVRTGPGLGLFAAGLTDQHFIERGRMGRLIDALHDTGISRGFGVSENCAMIVDLRRGEFEAIGNHGVCVLTVSLKSENDVRARLSVLSTGDRAELRTDKVTPRTGAKDARAHACIDHSLQTVDNIWARAPLLEALKAIGITTAAERALSDGRTTLTLAGDGRTVVSMREGDGLLPCMSNVSITVQTDAPMPSR